MEDDHEELLQYSDEDSVSETDDPCCPIDKCQDRVLYPLTFFPHTKLDFFVTLVSLILSTLTLLIVLPLYVSSINVRGNIYSLFAFNITLSTCILAVILVVVHYTFHMSRNRPLLQFPVNIWKLIHLAGVYVISIYLYLYGSDRNRVLCHLQDPIKGIVLVIALLYYFFFCRNLMGLHRIFSTTTVIVGLFIAVDYGLCDEFVCRGYDRQQIVDDAGPWSWKIHSIWTGLYIFSLILFASLYTLLDRYVAPNYDQMMPCASFLSPTFLNTISRSVVNEGTSTNAIEDESQENNDRRDTSNGVPMQKSPVSFAFWIHFFVLLWAILTFWIDFLHGFGKADSVAENLNFTLKGLQCHFFHDGQSSPHCNNVVWYALIFQMAYVIFWISSVRLLILSQSAVFTIAAMSYALPVVGIWWSLFYASPSGVLVWAPKIRGEFVCSIIGCPIVSVGLGLLCKTHFEDIRKPRNLIGRPLRS